MILAPISCQCENCPNEASCEWEWAGKNIKSCSGHYEKICQLADAIGTPRPIKRQLGSVQ